MVSWWYWCELYWKHVKVCSQHASGLVWDIKHSKNVVTLFITWASTLNSWKINVQETDRYNTTTGLSEQNSCEHLENIVILYSQTPLSLNGTVDQVLLQGRLAVCKLIGADIVLHFNLHCNSFALVSCHSHSGLMVCRPWLGTLKNDLS